MKVMTQIGLVVFIGVPGSGKTTYAKSLCQFIDCTADKTHVIHVCYDDFMPKNIVSDFAAFRYKDFRHNMISLLEKHILASRQSCGRDCLLLVDDNMYYRSMRFEVFNVARRLQTSYCQLMFDIPLGEALSRNRSRANKLPDNVVERMAMRLEKPSSLVKWEQNTKIMTDFSDKTETYSFIRRCLEFPESELEKLEPPVVAPSRIQLMDLLLRKEIGNRIRACESTNTKKDLSLLLNFRKQQILRDLRTGVIEVSQSEDITNYL